MVGDGDMRGFLLNWDGVRRDGVRKGDDATYDEEGCRFNCGLVGVFKMLGGYGLSVMVGGAASAVCRCHGENR